MWTVYLNSFGYLISAYVGRVWGTDSRKTSDGHFVKQNHRLIPTSSVR